MKIFQKKKHTKTLKNFFYTKQVTEAEEKFPKNYSKDIEKAELIN